MFCVFLSIVVYICEGCLSSLGRGLGGRGGDDTMFAWESISGLCLLLVDGTTGVRRSRLGWVSNGLQPS